MFVWPEISTDFLAGVVDPKSDLPTCYFVFDGSQILLNFDQKNQWHPADVTQAKQLTARQTHYMGCMGGVNYYALEAELAGEQKAGMRSLFGKVDHMTFSLAGRALQILDWFRSHQYCGRCGVAAERHDKDRAMVCEACNIHSYPRLSPSIITLVHRGDEVLLARNHNFPEGMYSTLAGFVEPGESIEETVRREVKEEVGVAVGSLEYLGSQPWPFPNSLMLGFLAEYESGDIVCQEEEIADAQWFPVNDLPKIPGSVAISRWIIDTYLARMDIKV